MKIKRTERNRRVSNSIRAKRERKLRIFKPLDNLKK
jgi:hypothetical protein